MGPQAPLASATRMREARAAQSRFKFLGLGRDPRQLINLAAVAAAAGSQPSAGNFRYAEVTVPGILIRPGLQEQLRCQQLL